MLRLLIALLTDPEADSDDGDGGSEASSSTDGSTRDVTPEAVLSSSVPDVATVDASGRVQAVTWAA